MINSIKFSTLFNYSIFLLLLFPVMPIIPNNYFIAITGLVAIGGFITLSRFKLYHFSYLSFLLPSSLIVLSLSVLYSNNLSAASSEIGKRMALIIFPLIFALRRSDLKTDTLRKVEHFFIAIIVIYMLFKNIELFIVFNKAINKGIIVNNWFEAIINPSFEVFYRNYFFKITNIHPTYATIYTLFSLGILLLNLIKGMYNENLKIKTLVLISMCFLLCYSILLAAKGPILAFIISIIIVLGFQLSAKQFAKTTIVLIVISVILTLSFPPLKNRVKEIITTKSDTEVNTNSISIRKIIHSTAWGLVKSNCFIGVGIGDVQDELNKQFKNYEQKEINDFDLNTHNEYFNLWASAGLIGLLSLIITFAIPIALAVKQKSFYALFFWVFMAVCFLFENILSRQKGVMFFSVFYVVYLFNIIDTRKCQQGIQNI